MPRVTAFNLRKDDPLPDIERALTNALVSLPTQRESRAPFSASSAPTGE
jgi:hypothetical protein